jgi:hypothetical protein
MMSDLSKVANLSAIPVVVPQGHALPLSQHCSAAAALAVNRYEACLCEQRILDLMK